MEILRCNNIEKVFGKDENRVTALNGINLSVEMGNFLQSLEHLALENQRFCI